MIPAAKRPSFAEPPTVLAARQAREQRRQRWSQRWLQSLPLPYAVQATLAVALGIGSATCLLLLLRPLLRQPASQPALPAPPLASAPPTPTTVPQTTVPQTAAPQPVASAASLRPRTAVDALLAGRHAEALVAYRQLAGHQANASQAAYRSIADILAAQAAAAASAGFAP